jgi:hypothetical protein
MKFLQKPNLISARTCLADGARKLFFKSLGKDFTIACQQFNYDEETRLAPQKSSKPAISGNQISIGKAPRQIRATSVKNLIVKVFD